MTFLCLAFAVTDFVTLGINYPCISLEAIFKTVPDNLLSPLLCLFRFVDCFIKIWFLFALLHLTEDPVLLKRLEAPECVLSLYPIILFNLPSL